MERATAAVDRRDGAQEDTVIYREIGTTGVSLSVMGLGGHEFLPDGRSKGFNEDFRRAITRGEILPGFGGSERRAVLKAAYDAGINFFDVTQDSEKEALGRNLGEMPPPFEVYVQTRPEEMMYDRDPGNRKMADYPQLRAEVERILKLLRRDRLDILNLGIVPDAYQQDPDYLTKLKATTDRLKEDGLVRFTSADTFRGERTYLRQIASGGFETMFVNLNFADAASRLRVLPAARAAGMAVIAREAFMKGELFKMAAEVGVEDHAALVRVALKWVLATPEVTSVVVGVATPAHLRASLAALDGGSLTEGEHALIERIKTSPLYRAYAAQRDREFLEEASPARI
jgi:aryl-alcohol dehydrogenase-like predicted oxidoreductase